MIPDAVRAEHNREKAGLQTRVSVLEERCKELERSLTSYRKKEAARSGPSPESIAAAIAGQHGLTLDDLRAHKRTDAIVQARYHAIYEVWRQCWHLSTLKIGKLFDRDHTVILYAIRNWPEKAAKLGIQVRPRKGGKP